MCVCVGGLSLLFTRSNQLRPTADRCLPLTLAPSAAAGVAAGVAVEVAVVVGTEPKSPSIAIVAVRHSLQLLPLVEAAEAALMLLHRCRCYRCWCWRLRVVRQSRPCGSQSVPEAPPSH